MLHKTLGGWQFGSRYTADITPAVLALIYGLAASALSGRARRAEKVFYAVCSVLLIFGIIFNVYGCITMF